jgi:hypothetical protein
MHTRECAYLLSLGKCIAPSEPCNWNLGRELQLAYSETEALIMLNFSCFLTLF